MGDENVKSAEIALLRFQKATEGRHDETNKETSKQIVDKIKQGIGSKLSTAMKNWSSKIDGSISKSASVSPNPEKEPTKPRQSISLAKTTPLAALRLSNDTLF